MYKKAQAQPPAPQLNEYQQGQKANWDTFAKTAPLYGLAGAGIGGLGLGLNRWLSSPEGETAKARRAGTIRQALLGALLGGAGGAAVPTFKYLNSDHSELPGWFGKHVGLPVIKTWKGHPFTTTAVAVDPIARTAAGGRGWKSMGDARNDAISALPSEKDRAVGEAIRDRIAANSQAVSAWKKDMGKPVQSVAYETPLGDSIDAIKLNLARTKGLEETNALTAARPVLTPPTNPRLPAVPESLQAEGGRLRGLLREAAPISPGRFLRTRWGSPITMAALFGGGQIADHVAKWNAESSNANAGVGVAP